MSSKKKENDLRKAALEGDLPVLNSLIASGTNLEGGAPKVRVCATPQNTRALPLTAASCASRTGKRR
jgi:hypothetical protein